MDLVIDANVIFSAAIKDSKTSELLFSDKFHLFTPEFLFTEFKKYEDILLDKTHRTEEDFWNFLDVLKRRVTSVPKEDFETYLENAKQISPDPKDVQYFALALKIKAAIWSDDNDLKKQNKVKVYNTTELVNLASNS